MILEGETSVPAQQQLVWEAIWDIPTLTSWVDGMVDARQVDDRTYVARLEQQVGLVKAAFDVTLTVVEAEPPSRIVIKMEGQDKQLATYLTLEGEITLVPRDEETSIRYSAELTISGKLAAMGHSVIQLTAARAEAEFCRRAAETFGAG